MRMFFFGVIGEPGHYLHVKENGRLRTAWSYEREVPFRYEVLDGGLMPQNRPQVQGLVHHMVINGWTVLTMWDRTCDSRPGCNAAFVMEGILDVDRAMTAAQAEFPDLWARIQPFKGDFPPSVQTTHVLTCVYCGFAYPTGTPTHGSAVLTEHLKTCEKHPMRALDRQKTKLREGLIQIAGSGCEGGNPEVLCKEAGMSPEEYCLPCQAGHAIEQADKEAR